MLGKIFERLPKPFKTLAIRFDRSPIDNVEALSEFVRTRSSYVAQTSMFGYLKARMGTRFPQFFEDEVFSRSIRIASARLFVSCLGDLTVFAVAHAVREVGTPAEEANHLAGHCFQIGMKRTLADLESEAVLSGAMDNFHARAGGMDWDAASNIDLIFAGSQRDIIRFAPVVDEFKSADQEIVGNSIRFRWRDVREQLKRRVDGGGVVVDWREQYAPPPNSQT